MQFKNPYILYALFLLLIPIIIHLFQLRRFKKTPFSNLAFLQAVVKNTRKSSTIKKWLILASRLLALTALILAFAQPFFPNSSRALQEREQVIFLDNSFSMQAKGNKGSLLTEAVQDLVASGKTNLNLLTFNQAYKNLNASEQQNKLLNLQYTSQTQSPEALNLALRNTFSKGNSVAKELIIISDFQSVDAAVLDSLKNIEQHRVQLRPVQKKNLYLDSLKITRQQQNYILEIQVKNSVSGSQKVPVSLYNKEKLISKATANFEETNKTSVEFRVPVQDTLWGTLSIQDAGITYDNSFYFYLDTPQPLTVLSINQAKDDFIKKIYSNADYNYQSVPVSQVDFNTLNTTDAVILNELDNISQSLTNRLLSFRNNGGVIIFIPNANAKASIYTNFLQAFDFPRFEEKSEGEYKITSINYNHPVYKNVFERESTNFQYPSLSTSFRLNSQSAALRLQDGNAFLAKGNGIFVFSAALNNRNTNFQDSPLVVPTFEEMAKAALRLPKSFYYLGEDRNFDVKANGTGDAVYKLRLDEQVYIPLQERKGNTVSISTREGLDQAGIYELTMSDSVVGQVAFNYNRMESVYSGTTSESVDNYAMSNSVKASLQDIQEASSLNELYKWFLCIAIVFLFTEMLILKFFK